jgi:hypothetical protein
MSVPCENCNAPRPTIVNNQCSICDYPIEGSVKNQRAYRRQLADTKHFFKKLSELNRGFLRAGLFCLSIAFLIFIFTVLFTPSNLPFVYLLSGSGIYLLLIAWFADLNRIPYIAILGGFYLLTIILEYLIFGLPHRLIDGLGVEDGWIGFIPIVNSLTPIFYLLLKIGLLTPFITGIYYHWQIRKTPEKMLAFVKTLPTATPSLTKP